MSTKSPKITIVVVVLSLLWISFGKTWAQGEIPLGTWRSNLSYNKIFCIAIGKGVVYGASTMGIVAYDKAEQTFFTLNKVNGLTSSGITWIAFHAQTDQLLVTYEDGNIDIVRDQEVSNFSRLKELNTIVGSKRINHASTHNGLAYIATDFGIVVFDMQLRELKETWRDLGPGGANIQIFQTAFLQDSIYAATSKGVIAGKLSDNLLDFNNWKRYDSGDLNRAVATITSLNNKIYAGVTGAGIYRIGSSVVKEPFLNGADFQSLDASANALLIVANKKIWQLESNQNLSEITTTEITTPLTARFEEAEVLWIGDSTNGLVSNVRGDFQHFLPNGPNVEQAFRLRSINNKLYVLNGGYNLVGEALGNAGTFDYMENGIWKSKTVTVQDVTDVIEFGNKFYAASFGDGLLEEDANATILYNESNSTLLNTSPLSNAVNISALELGHSGLLVANFGANPSLHLLKHDRTWASFSATTGAARYPIDMTEDLAGNVWVVSDPTFGGGLFVYRTDGTIVMKTDVAGAGGLLNKYARCITADRDGNIWVGTEGGVGYFYAETEDAIIPIFENRFLLKDDIIYDIEVDGANRKWMATRHGAWLFNATGEELIYNFKEDNSPLVSDMIHDIEINHNTGEVFFATDKGIVSFRAEATTGAARKSPIKIFPNPVTAQFNGTIGISGLVTDAVVKITDTSGKLIWQTQAQGGTAMWNLRDQHGRRASTGIYLVFAATAEGKESVAGKIAVIE